MFQTNACRVKIQFDPHIVLWSRPMPTVSGCNFILHQMSSVTTSSQLTTGQTIKCMGEFPALHRQDCVECVTKATLTISLQVLLSDCFLFKRSSSGSFVYMVMWRSKLLAKSVLLKFKPIKLMRHERKSFNTDFSSWRISIVFSEVKRHLGHKKSHGQHCKHCLNQAKMWWTKTKQIPTLSMCMTHWLDHLYCIWGGQR